MPFVASLVWLRITVVIVCVSLVGRLSATEPLSYQSDFVQRLLEPHSGTIDGSPLRIALRIVSQGDDAPDRHINICLDRRVDPDAIVSPGELGPTRFASLVRIAQAGGCVCYPVHNCVLIGRQRWVGTVARKLLSVQRSSAARSSAERHSARQQRPRSRGSLQADRPIVADRPIDIAWPPLTTPAEALSIVAANSSLEAPRITLPHDLWPAIQWRQIRPLVAYQLIQLQCLPELDLDSPEETLTRSYQFSATASAVPLVRKADPAATFRRSGSKLVIASTIAGHRSFCSAVLSRVSGAAVAATDGDRSDDPIERLKGYNRQIKSITVKQKPAGAVLQSLAAKVDVQCVFDDDANQIARQLVSLSVEETTLWELVNLVAKQVSLKIQAEDGKLRVSTK